MFLRKKEKKIQHPAAGLIIFAILVVMAVGVKLWQRYYYPTVTFALKGQTLHLLLADTPARQFLGLGKRDSLGNADGMLFIFPDPKQYGFVMRDMRFSIDIIWLSQGKVVDIAPNLPLEPGASEAQLRVYYPRDVANAVIEFPAGWANQHGLAIGDQLTSL